jgi:hypothetical protein
MSFKMKRIKMYQQRLRLPLPKVALMTCMYLLLIRTSEGQDLERILEKDKLKIKGGVNASQNIYMQRGGDSRRTPYNYFLSGRMALSYGQFSVPLSFSYSNQRINYGQPFNILGLSPKYKWITTHVGYRSMTFSPYTLSGHAFLGAGVEIEPKKGWKTSAMYGRMMKAVAFQGNNRPSYERFGYGFKTEYQTSEASVGISMFSAKDNPLSINDSGVANLTPQQNLVLGLSLFKKIKHWSVRLEGARSAYTRNLYAQSTDDKRTVVDAVYWMPRYTSTGYFNAYKATLNYQFRGFTLGGNYERIDPGYRTLGAYFFNDDLQSLSGQFSTALFKNKLSISANLGKQRNNLDKTKISTMDRWVSAVQLNFVPTPKLNTSLSFSSFQSFTNVRPLDNPTNSTLQRPLDTLSFVSISRSGQGSVSYTIQNNEFLNSNIMISGSVQGASQNSRVANNYNPTFYNGFISYSHGMLKQKLQTGVGINTNLSGEGDQKSVFLGPNANASKVLWSDIWRIQANVSWNAVWLAGSRVSSVTNIGLGNNFAIHKNHNLSCNLTYLYMRSPSVALADNSLVRAINEVNIQMGYSYVF